MGEPFKPVYPTKDPPTELIPPVPATPPQGTRTCPQGWVREARLDEEPGYVVFGAECLDPEACNQGAPCWQTKSPEGPILEVQPLDEHWERGTRGDRSGVSVLLVFVVLWVIAASVLAVRLLTAVGDVEARMQTRTTEQLMDWSIARMSDRDVAEVCRGWRDPEWRTDTGDRFQIALSKMTPDSEIMPKRVAIDGYLNQMCAADGWGRAKR